MVSLPLDFFRGGGGFYGRRNIVLNDTFNSRFNHKKIAAPSPKL